MEQYNQVKVPGLELEQSSAPSSEIQYLLTVVKQLEIQLERQSRKISRLESRVESLQAQL